MDGKTLLFIINYNVYTLTIPYTTTTINHYYTNTADEYVGSLAHGLKPLSGMYHPAIHACKLSCELRLKVD